MFKIFIYLFAGILIFRFIMIVFGGGLIKIITRQVHQEMNKDGMGNSNFRGTTRPANPEKKQQNNPYRQNPNEESKREVEDVDFEEIP
jgi:hypothetical protein